MFGESYKKKYSDSRAIFVESQKRRIIVQNTFPQCNRLEK